MTVVGWGQVEQLLLFDLSWSGVTIPHSRLLKKPESIICDEYKKKYFLFFFSDATLIERRNPFLRKGFFFQ